MMTRTTYEGEGKLLVSPSEPAEFKTIGNSSSVPELYGVDFLWPTKNGLAGVQRKEINDLANSANDGRLYQELSQMQELTYKALIIEGRLQWTENGTCLNVRSWSLPKHLGVVLQTQLRGCWHLTSTSQEETIRLILQLKRWTDKDSHSSLLTRPNPTGKWGKADNRDWAIHLLQSFPGIGYNLACRIYDHFGGLPLQWTADLFELMEVDGLGEGKASGLLGAFDEQNKTNQVTSDNPDGL